MPTIKKSVTVAAGASATPISGSPYEFLPFDALVEVAILADTGENIEASVSSGSDILMESSTVDILAVASPIIYPDHYAVRDVAAAGERLGITVWNREASGSAVVRVAVQITPL